MHEIWQCAIMRSLASHLLRRPELRQQLRDEQADEIERSSTRRCSTTPAGRSIYSEVRDISISGRPPISCPVPRRSALGRPRGSAGRGHLPVQADLFLPGRAGRGVQLPRPHVLAQMPGGVLSTRSCGCSATTSSAGTCISSSASATSSCRRCTGQNTAPRYYNEPHIRVLTGTELAALPASAETAAAAAVAADAAPRRRPPHDPRLARGQRPVAGTRRRRNDRGLPARPHQADPARHHLARQRAERGGPAAEAGGPRRPAASGSPGGGAALRQAVRRLPAGPVRQPDLVGPDAAERRPAQLLRVCSPAPRPTSAACRKTSAPSCG